MMSRYITDTRIPWVKIEMSHVELISLKEIRIFSHEDFLVLSLLEEKFSEDVAISLEGRNTSEELADEYRKHCRAVRIPIGDRYYMAYRGPECLFTFSEKIECMRDPGRFFSM
jgi:hypothetical protein